MKNLKTVKRLAAAVCCFVLAGTAGAAEAAQNGTAGEETVFLIEASAPYTKYFCRGVLSLVPLGGQMKVDVTTLAFQDVDHIYHDVTIFKNGSFYSAGRYEDWNKFRLDSNFNVPAQSGDYIDVYVDHYTEHNGIVESESTSKAMYY